MKKLLSTIALLGVLVLPASALASAITLAPTTVSTVAGKTFSVTVGVNPTSGKAYTVRANLSFDPSLVTFTGFSFASKWMQLPQAGYDVEDNTNGIMAKTGGYPGGITAQTTLGTATFLAKKTGTATIAGTADSLILDSNNQNAVAGSQGSAKVSIAAASVTPPVVKPSSPAVTNTNATATTTEIATTTVAGTEIVPQTAAALSSLDNILTLGTGSAAVASLLTLVVLLIIGGGIWFWRRR